jgi:hypothetical protein
MCSKFIVYYLLPVGGIALQKYEEIFMSFMCIWEEDNKFQISALLLIYCVCIYKS